MDTSSDFFSGKSNSYYLEYPANAQTKSKAESYKNIYLFIWVFMSFQHCTTDSWKGIGNHYIKLVKVLYCKLLATGK